MSTAKAGTLLAITEGCYSDFNVHGFYVVLKDFDPAAMKDQVSAALEEDSYRGHDTYIAELIRCGFILEIQYATIHVGNYSQFDRFRFAETGELV